MSSKHLKSKTNSTSRQKKTLTHFVCCGLLPTAASVFPKASTESEKSKNEPEGQGNRVTSIEAGMDRGSEGNQAKDDREDEEEEIHVELEKKKRKKTKQG